MQVIFRIPNWNGEKKDNANNEINVWSHSHLGKVGSYITEELLKPQHAVDRLNLQGQVQGEQVSRHLVPKAKLDSHW